MEEKGNFITINKIWEEINQESVQLEKELLLVECIHSFWESKQKQNFSGEINIEEIDSIFNEILKILK